MRCCPARTLAGMAARARLVGLALIALVIGCAPAPAQPTPAAPTRDPTAAPVSLDKFDFSTRGWRTNFSKAVVPLAEIRSGGPPRDGIPPIDEPKFVVPMEASAWLKEQEPVIAFYLNGDARAYPLQILIWHEIVNDVVGDVPVALT